MTGFLVETLVWTGVLIALVLLLRRPVAQLLGARAAYALWALPVARLFLPPITLPAWMAPAPGEASAFVAVPMETGPATIATAAPVASPVDWAGAALAIWLGGAAVFLLRRFALYFQMRRDLLAAARPVGRAGRVRLVETPAADGPVAFGVIDKVVALPTGFMASQDRAARDLALAHELAHHRAHDLLVNMAVQPLFALHWFNPLSALGWRAMRRDQEAACDARVVASEPADRRAAYAEVIARFAVQPHAAPRLALAAPMACPVLGDRSIVHRLRSLAMDEVSLRRRWAGRLLIAGAALALPLTATISYAQDAPPAPPAAPEPPAPPSAAAEPAVKHRVIRIERVEKDGAAPADGADAAEPGRTERRVIIRHGERLSAEDKAALHREIEEMEKTLADGGNFRRKVRIAIAEARNATPQVSVECRDGQTEVSETVTGADGRELIYVCSAIAMAEAKTAMATARAEIARSRELSEQARAEALRALDEAEKGRVEAEKGRAEAEKGRAEAAKGRAEAEKRGW